jgi:histidyl-tRNA synthetase
MSTTSWNTVLQGFDSKKMNSFIIKSTSNYSVISTTDETTTSSTTTTQQQQQQPIYQGGYAPKGKQRENQKYEPKTPLGMVDIHPDKMQSREFVFNLIKNVFKKHGAVELETPVCELKETLTGKYGEDSKLVYDLQDQGGELLSLRYDLTVPFARYIAQHGIDRMRRFHIARVYRRDRPNTDKGRFREFYQCDFDAAGEYEDMVPDTECVKIVSDILTGVGLNEYLIKINHRGLLDGVFGLCGVPQHLYRPICSAVDKLDKEEWPVVREEMLQKGISESVADLLGEFVEDVKVKSNLEGITRLIESVVAKNPGNELKSHQERCMVGVNALRKLNQYAVAMNVDMSKVTFDMSMARGLDYYTGVIFEVVLTGKTTVGSIAGGGRYDNLVGMFDKKHRTVPCVGISIGIERLFSILEDRRSQTIQSRLDVYVGYISGGSKDKGGDEEESGNTSIQERMKLCAMLWDAGFRAEFLQKGNPKLNKQFEACENACCPLFVYCGSEELKAGVVKIKRYQYSPPTEVGGKIQHQTMEEIVVKRDEVVDKIKQYLGNR